MVYNIRGYFTIFFLLVVFILSCETTSQPRDNGNGTDISSQTPIGGLSTGSLAEEIRHLTETGVLSSMLQALELIRGRDLSGAEFGRIMTGINILLIRLVYPDSPARLPSIDLPQTSNYTRIIREAERGNYIGPAANSSDFFEHILPFLAINENTSLDTLQNVLRDLEKARILRPNSILPLYFQGIIHERLGRFSEAETAYNQAYMISSECYPAQIGIARVRRLSGNTREAVSLFSELTIRFPDSVEIRRQLAISYFENEDWTRALSAVDEFLRTDNRNLDFLLMKASIHITLGQFPQANAALDICAAINANHKSYLYMRARVQFEGNRNRDSALNYLRSILRSHPDDIETMVYMVTLLMESSRPADQNEGRELLARLRQIAGSSIEVISLSIKDAVRRESWLEAQGFLNRVLAVRRTAQDLTDAYYVERGLGNNPRALTYARELYDRDNSNNDYAFVYISALIDNGRRDEASRLVESRLNSAPGGVVKSRWFFLRSRLQTNQEAALVDLRYSIFEDPRNLDAHIASFMIYHNRREEGARCII
ncbi:MAG: tetratricopeptide repeat protein [Treponema sp.]|nr:tetratricopeptide repeat protein [Treponema sp.]